LALTTLALLPAFAWFLGAPISAMIVGGLSLGAAMMLIGLRADWALAGWAGMFCAGFWALLGLALGGDAASTSAGLTLAAAGGLTHTLNRRGALGPIMAMIMAACALALGARVGMIGPAGAAFALIVAAAAIIGALRLRREALHFGAFAASLIGLFVLSGQPQAAIWFTPAASWAGALFFAIAMVRVPRLGARGASLAATGALSGLFAIAALFVSRHGLADANAAASAFIAFGLALGGLIRLAMDRRARGAAGLKLSLWVLGAGAFIAFASAIALAAPTPLAAPSFAALALSFMALNTRAPAAVWRCLANVAGASSGLAVSANATIMLSDSPHWPAWALIVCGFALPALLTLAAARAAHRAHAHTSAGWLDFLALLFAIASANLTVRALFSGGTPLLESIGFVETGAHVAVWLGAALAMGARAEHGALRLVLATILTGAALTASVVAASLWLTPYWGERASTDAWLWRQGLGFLAPAIGFLAHWRFWRARSAGLRARCALAAGALSSAAFITLETTRADEMPEWASALIGACVFAMAIAVNFAPAIARGSNLEKNFHRRGRGQQRSQMR
jgi:hypothetical protein